jgi:hypothetical protein
MGGWRLALALGLTCVLGSQARFVIEQGGLKISFPQSAARANPHGFDMSLANFGSPKYGGSLMRVSQPLAISWPAICPPDLSCLP